MGVGCFILLLVGIVCALNVVTRLNAARGDSRECLFRAPREFVDIDGIRLHYVQRGSGQPVVFLHGSDGFIQDFSDTLFPLLENDACCIAFDRPGHGLSDVPDLTRMTLDGQAGLLHDALLRLDVRHPILVGHSWGAALAAMLAVNNPGDYGGLVLISGYLYPGAKVTAWLLRLPLRILLSVPRIPLLGPLVVSTLTPLVRPFVLRVGLRLAFRPDPVPTDYARKVYALWIRSTARIRALAEENSTDEHPMERLATEYGRLDIPLFAIVGDSDKILPPDAHTLRFAREHESTRLTVIQNAGHQLTITHPAEIAGVIRQCMGIAPPEPPPTNPTCIESDFDRARSLVFRYGWNSTAYQILNPAMRHWFDDSGQAAVGYVAASGVRIAAGAPVCDESNLGNVARAFEAEAAANGETVCWFGAAERMWEALSPPGDHARIVVGAQPVWSVARWPEIVDRNSSLRAQLNRARNKGVVVEEWDRDRAAESEELRRVLDEWMETRAMPRLGFLTEPVSPDRLADRRIFVALRMGDPVAFLVCVPIPKRNGWMVEQIARTRAAPNGTAELLVDRAMETLRGENAEVVTLGLAPLSTRAESVQGSAAPLVNLLLLWVRAHGRRFYNFEGLDAFKAKFRPDYWEPLYAIANEPQVSVRTLYAIAAAFSEGPPLRFVWRAITTAARQELAWFRQKLQKK